MLKYSFKIFIRNLSRRKLFSFINISGLAFATAFILLIGQFLFHELSHNKHFDNIDNIYRLVDSTLNIYNIDYRFKDKIETVPGVKNVSLLNHYSIEVNNESSLFKLDHMLIADPDFLEMFKLKFIHGNPETSLSAIDAIILTESTAKSIFGTTDVLEKTLLVDHEYEMYITGVVKDLPSNTSILMQVIVSLENSLKSRLRYRQWGFGNFPFNFFIELHDNADLNLVEKQISSLKQTIEYQIPGKMLLVPLSSDYFNTQITEYDLSHGNKSLVQILALIGIIILSLAVINFINLTTAAYRYRLTEIGIKKCFGINRRTLIQQLLLESFFICLLSSLLSIIIAELLLPYFNQFTERELQIQIFSNLNFNLLFILFIISLSLLAGLTPALILSKISPLQLFHLKQYFSGSGKTFRNILTMFQFGVTTILISCLIIMRGQIDYVKHKNPGFNTERLIYIKPHFRTNDRIPVLVDKFSRFHQVKSITMTFGAPGNLLLEGGDRDITFKFLGIDSTTLKTFGFKIVEGRDLLPGDAGKACLINQTAWKELEMQNLANKKAFRYDVVGVISDFHISSLHTKTQPLILKLDPSYGTSHITIRFSGSVAEIIENIKTTWKEICPEFPLEIGFYDEFFASQYRKEENLATLISIFSILAVAISCLGIFGLAFYQTEQRIKEIGIRKVLGASPFEIVSLLSKNFSKWVILANIVAWPAAYYFMRSWLENFAYHIELNWWMFILSGGIALLIALATISFQAIKAATANPVKSLRYE